MKSSSERINIAATAQRLDVDNRISLRYYYRISDNILKQASIFREEKNIIDLYVMLLSLVSETIPCHRDYRSSAKSKKDYLRKPARSAMREPTYQNSRAQQLSYPSPLEDRFRKLSLRPRPKDETLTRHSILGPNGLHGQWQPPTADKGIRYPSVTDLSPIEILSQHPVQMELTVNKDNEDNKDGSHLQEERLPLESTPTQSSEDNRTSQADDSLISFEEIETPARVEIIRQPSPPPVLAEVQDLIPTVSPQVSDVECGVDVLSADESIRAESPLQLHISTTLMENFMKMAKSNTDRNLETCGVLAGSLKNRKFYVTALIIPKQESTSDSCQTTNEEEIFEVQDKRSLFPLGWIHEPLSFVKRIPIHQSRENLPANHFEKAPTTNSLESRMRSPTPTASPWLKTKASTSTLTSHLLEHSTVDQQFWIEPPSSAHPVTHPTQSCFMSSIDVHTHYSYQIMLPESVAIVMAPRDTSRNHGIFRLTTPGGMSVIRNCQQRGFHPHDPLPDGGPLYKTCTDVYMNPNLNFDVIDLR
ncbi:hypothetical protein TIFTF001_025870 [Ficus carica]|uniref:MPN domain-containing protein n=1 Tax=Ficus carica TaxID=3494 RepID=A0AA88DKM9_FICCA|nr:hypothetical protein TIFTF001_025870 [Ficus carica]